MLYCTSADGGDIIVGVKTGHLSVDAPKHSNPTNLALTLAYEIDNHLVDLRIEGEINRSLAEGEDARGGDLEFESNGLYLVGKTSHSLFMKFRAGFAGNRISGNGETTRDEGLALGFGVGVVSGKTRLLVEYAEIAGDAGFLTFGIEF